MEKEKKEILLYEQYITNNKVCEVNRKKDLLL